MQPPIFREQALEHLSSPEQLDQTMQVTPLRGWLALLALAAVVAVAVAWGIFGTIPIQINAQGLLLGGEGIRRVLAPGDGVVSMHRRGGDSVKQGGVVIQIKDPSGKDVDVASEYDGLVVARLRALDDTDLEEQVALIEGSLYTHLAREATSPLAAQTPEGRIDAAEPLTPDQLVARATAIAARLRERAICAADGSATWIAPAFLVHAERFQLQPVGLELYGGACGIGLFLAAVERVSGGAGYRALAHDAVQPLRRALDARDARVARWSGIGAGAGMGGVVYALTRMSQFLEAPALLDDARQAASLITPARIGADDLLDVVSGAAGAILGLLALYAATGEPAALAAANACGEHLLAARTPSAAGYRAWATLDGKLLTGFSHGAAGIAYALTRLHAIMAEPRLLEAAAEAIAYEDSVYSPEAGNWPDLRGDGAPVWTVQWCHGATGIGLARLGGLPALGSAAVQDDVESALRTTATVGLGPIDHLCCGNLGRAELLFAAGRRLARPALVESAGRYAAAVVARAERVGAYALHPLLPASADGPGLFQGTAGIGYELLRLARPDLVPSVLLWE